MKLIKEYLDSKGFDLSPIGIKGKALNKNDALILINIIFDCNVAILGGDVYYINNNGDIDLTYDNWYCDRVFNEEYTAFVKRSIDVSIRYIKGYKNDLYDMKNIIFDFVIDSNLVIPEKPHI